MNRSYLFIPGDVPRMLQNCDVFDSDAIIIDFEDAVSYEEKDEARALTRAFLTRYQSIKPEIYIRVNAPTDDQTLFTKDIEAIKDLPLSGLVIPKMTKACLKISEDVLSLKALDLKVIGIIETPDAFFDLESIAKHDRIKGLLLGGEDLTKSLGIERTKKAEELLFARSQLIMAMHATQKEAIDTPFTDTLDDQGFAEDTQFAKQLGFTGKSSIHPNHVHLINEVFAPDQAVIDQALRIITMHTKTKSMRFSLDGKMIDKPVIERAKKTLKKALLYNKIKEEDYENLQLD